MEIIDILQYYTLFCLTTAFAGLFIFFRPTLHSAIDCEVRNELTTSPVLAQCVFVIVSALVAPALFLAIVIPEISKVFHKSLESVMFDEN